MSALGLAAGAAGGLASLAAFALASLAGIPAPTTPSPLAVAAIPPAMLTRYVAAAGGCPGLDWTVLAAVGAVESDHGQSTAPGVASGANSAGAEGPMQFLAATFAAYDHPVPADPVPTPPTGAAPPSPYDATDAIYAAARYLCSLGVASDPADALVAYNCGNPGPACQAASAGYAAQVLATAAAYTALGPATGAGVGAGVAAAAALSALGTPYVWGGASPAGFDCSGLAQWAYARAGIALPRTAQAQYDAGPALPAGQAPAPGDLVFFGAGVGEVSHVGIVVGPGVMIDAPHPGALVRLDPITGFTPAYLGATDPGAAR
ncbi:MAG: C40 family peptidase [Mycobacteriales bacterium]